MNLYFRLLSILIKCLMARLNLSKKKEKHICFRILPTDIDIMGHLTSSRYIAFTDLARLSDLLDQGILQKLLRSQYRIAALAQNLVHIREIKPFTKILVSSELIEFDDHFWYYRHQIMEKSAVMAEVYVKGCILKSRKIVSPKVAFSQIGYKLNSKGLNESFKNWLDIVKHEYLSLKQIKN